MVAKLEAKVEPHADITSLAEPFLVGAQGRMQCVNQGELSVLLLGACGNAAQTTTKIVIHRLNHEPFVDKNEPDITSVKVVGVEETIPLVVGGLSATTTFP